MKKIFLSLLLLSSLGAFAQKTYEANWASIDSRPVPGWFEDSKFGIFIHWGLFSVPSFAPTARDVDGVYDQYSEWYWWKWQDKKGRTYPIFQKFHDRVYGADFKYQDFVKDFKAELFKPNEWAKIIEQSGAKYVVLTSKHHEGFTLWPSAQSWNWNAMDVGPHRDLLGDLTTAVKEKGLHMGYYYSLYEWYNPLYRKNVDKYVDNHMIPQLKDLVTTYKPDVVWTDGEWDHPSNVWKSTEFLAWLYNESPVKETVVVNDRWGKETRSKHGGFYTTEYDLVHEGNSDNMKFNRPWEECRGIGGSFGYNRAEILEDYSSSAQLIHILVEKVARGGNLLLNIGPTADGRIPVIMQQRLKDIGDWMKVNNQAIYGTRAWEKAPAFKKGNKIFFTQKGKDVYVLTTEWMNTIPVENINTPKSVTLLGYKGEVKTSIKGSQLTITAPSLTPATIPCQHAWVYKLEGAAK